MAVGGTRWRRVAGSGRSARRRVGRSGGVFLVVLLVFVGDSGLAALVGELSEEEEGEGRSGNSTGARKMPCVV